MYLPSLSTLTDQYKYKAKSSIALNKMASTSLSTVFVLLEYIGT